MTSNSPHQHQTLYGHHDIVARLKKSKDDNTLHHALILAGPEGVGKETLAYQLIRYALAFPNASGPQADFRIPDDHPVAKKIAAQSHPHVFTIQPVYDDKKGRFKRDITLDALSGIQNFLRLMPLDDAPRFIVINPADSLNNNTQNALLKMLEEPPARTHFLLLTTQLGRLLPTIRSRCLTLQLQPLSFADFSKALTQLKPNLSTARIQALYTLSQGALGQALQNEELDLLDSYGDLCRAVLEWHHEGNSQPAMKFAETLSRDDILPERLMQVVYDRIAMVLKHSITGQNLIALIPEEEGVLTLWASQPHARLLGVYDAIRSQWEAGEVGYLDKKLVLLQVLQQLSTQA